MEDDIVLSYEVHELRILALPPLLPALRKELLSVRDISDRGIEPHIEDLSVSTLHRHRHTPVKVTAHGTRLKAAVDPALALAIYIASPLLVPVEDPLRQPSFILIKRQIPMLCLLLHKFASAESRLRVNEFVRTECRTALLALVSIGSFGTAARAGSCDVTVCEEGLGLLIVVLLAHLLDELALFIELPEEIRSILMMGL